MSKLTINNLHVSIENKEILKGISFEVQSGEMVAILGPNGHGKSTLLNAIMGHPRYKITQGSILLDDKDILTLTVDQRARAGLFLGLQNPCEVPGVTNSDFYRAAVNAKAEKPISTYNFYKMLDKATKEVKIPFDLATRSLNEGFSGGEKKRNEILQMMLLNPKVCMLDEIDSGLDVDAIGVVSDVIRKEKNDDRIFLVISHYARLFDLIQPTRTIVIVNGKVAIDGGSDIIKRIDSEGYEFIKTELGINIEKEDALNTVSIGSCAVKEAIKK